MSGSENKNKTNLFGIPDEVLKKAARSFLPITQIIIKHQQNIQIVNNKLSKFVSENQSLIHAIAEISKNPQDMYGKYLSEKHRKLTEFGYFVSFSSLTLGEMRTLLTLLESKNSVAIDQYFCSRLNKYEIFTKIKSHWENNPAFEERKRFLLRGIKAHYDKDYIVSIPVLLPHVEGILADFLITTGLLQTSHSKLQGNKALSLLKKITLERILYEVDKIQFRRYIDKNKIYGFTTDEASVLNRGKILHGTSLNYDREDWSAKLIYLIDFLSRLTEKDWNIEKSKDGNVLLKKHKNE